MTCTESKYLILWHLKQWSSSRCCYSEQCYSNGHRLSMRAGDGSNRYVRWRLPRHESGDAKHCAYAAELWSARGRDPRREIWFEGTVRSQHQTSDTDARLCGWHPRERRFYPGRRNRVSKNFIHVFRRPIYWHSINCEVRPSNLVPCHL